MKLFWKKVLKGVRLCSNASYLRALRFGVAAAIEHERLMATLPCKMVIDIGANRGQFALVSRSCFPDALIVSFEPLDAPARIYKHVFFGDHKCRLHQLAIGAESGEHIIHLSARDDSSSLLQITDLQNKLFPGTAEKCRKTIKMARLDEVLTSSDIEQPALLKLDVQGFELGALKGCESLLAHFRWVYVEASFVELYKNQAYADQVIAWLRGRGFFLGGVYNMIYDCSGQAIQADFLFHSQSLREPTVQAV